jgi:hypothetical protein
VRAWSGARFDQSALVRQDHRLDPVPKSELGQQAVYVRFDCCLGQEKAGRDLGVGQPFRDEQQYFAFPRRQLGEFAG